MKGPDTLADLVGLVIELKPTDPVRLSRWPVRAPFRASFSVIQPERKPWCGISWAEALLHVHAYLGPAQTPIRRNPDHDPYITLLRSQFPSLYLVDPYSVEDDIGPPVWVMNDRDYALMRVFFGGSGWEA